MNEKLKITAVTALAIMAVIYAALFYLVFNLSLGDVVPVFVNSEPSYLIPTLSSRTAALLFHSFSWYFILKVFRKNLPPVKVLAITLTAIFTEILIPIGGITEVAKVLLTSQFLTLSPEVILSALLIHRILLALITALVMVVTINVIKPPLDTLSTIITPIAALLILNVAALLIPSSRMFGKTLDRLASRFNISMYDFSSKYKESLKRLLSEGKLALILTSLTILLEKVANGIYGVYLCRLMSYSIDFFTSLVIFDFLYIVMWLLPVVTPGNLGVFEALQIMIFKLLNTPLRLATLIALTSRAITLITEIPLMMLSTTHLGMHARQLIKTVISKREY